MTSLTAHLPPAPRLLASLFPAAFLVLVVMALYNFAQHGEASELTRRLSGLAILAHEGKLNGGEIVAAYPPLSFLLLFSLQALIGLAPADAPAMLCALLATALGWLWFRSFRKAGDSVAIAASITFLVIANPLFLRIVAAGPHALIDVLSFWLFARTAISLRRFGDVDALMLCSASLIMLTLSGPFGFLVALLCAVGVVVAFPSEIVWRARPAVLLALLFPVALTVAGLVFVNWLLLHDGFAFVPDSLRFGIDPGGAPWDMAPRTLLLACLACPLVLVALFDHRVRGFPVILLAYILFGAATLGPSLGLTTSPARAISLSLPVAAVIAEHWGRDGHRLKILAGLLGLGLFGGFLAANADRPSSAAGYAGMIERAIPRYTRYAADDALARHISGRTDIMFDAAAHPMVVAARDSARGLVTGNDPEFQLAVLRRKPVAHSIVVHKSDPSRTDDAISRSFPELYAAGAPGYVLDYDRAGWRVWTRRASSTESNQ